MPPIYRPRPSEATDGPLDAAQVFDWLDELIERTCPSAPRWSAMYSAVRLPPASPATGRPARRLVLVDSLGLAVPPGAEVRAHLVGFHSATDRGTYERFMRQCSFDLDGLREQMGGDWEPFVSYNLGSPARRARRPRAA